MLKIFATDKATGEHFEIKDLYWFEENFVRDFNDEYYTFEVFVNDVMVYPENAALGEKVNICSSCGKIRKPFDVSDEDYFCQGLGMCR